MIINNIKRGTIKWDVVLKLKMEGCKMCKICKYYKKCCRVKKLQEIRDIIKVLGVENHIKAFCNEFEEREVE